jgi:hypothetical protein
MADRVKYWQVGNERCGAAYEERLADFCKSMKEVDPTIVLLSSYPRRGVLRKGGEWIHHVCPHHYDCGNLVATEKALDAVRELCRKESPKRPIKVAVTEWNTTAGDWGSNLINSFCSGIIQTDNHRLYKTPTYYAQQLYSTLSGDRPLGIDSTLSPRLYPDTSATLSADGKVVTLFAVNLGPRDITRRVDLTAFGAGGQEVAVWTLADSRKSGEPDVTNSFGEPERVAPVRTRFRVGSAKFEYRFPAWSLAVLRWKVGK